MAFCSHCFQESNQLFTIFSNSSSSNVQSAHEEAIKDIKRLKSQLDELTTGFSQLSQSPWPRSKFTLIYHEVASEPNQELIRTNQKQAETTIGCHGHRTADCLLNRQQSDLATGFAMSTTFLDIPWTDVIFEYVLDRLSWQEVFKLRRVSKLSRTMIGEYLSQLTTINLKPIGSRFTPRAFEITTRDTQRLQVLNCSGCKWLTDEQLSPLIVENDNLKVFDVSECFEVTNRVLELLATNSPNLRTLRLKECHWINLKSLIALAIDCKQLEDIDLTSCWEINDDVAIELILNCEQLRRLSLSKIYGITDRTLLTLASSSKNLEVLDVSGCWRVTDYGVRMVGEYCSKLRTLIVGDCRDVTEESLSGLRCRGIKVDIPTRRTSRALRLQI